VSLIRDHAPEQQRELARDDEAEEHRRLQRGQQEHHHQGEPARDGQQVLDERRHAPDARQARMKGW